MHPAMAGNDKQNEEGGKRQGGGAKGKRQGGKGKRGGKKKSYGVNTLPRPGQKARAKVVRSEAREPVNAVMPQRPWEL